jgi:hypothetical protein
MNRPPNKAEVEAIRERWSGEPTGRYPEMTERLDYSDVHRLLDYIDYQEMLLKDSRDEMREAGRGFREIERERAALIQKYEDEKWGAW